MKNKWLFAMLLTFSVNTVYADWDAKLEAEEAAQRKAEQQKAAAEKAKTDAIMKQYKDKADAEQAARDKKDVAKMRKDLGKQANGKSDAEVKAMFNAKVQNDVKTGQEKALAGRHQTDAEMKKMYGKDMKDIMNMTDEEREAFANEVEKKYNH